MESYFQHQNVHIVRIIFQVSLCSSQDLQWSDKVLNLNKQHWSRDLNHLQTGNKYILPNFNDKLFKIITAKMKTNNRILTIRKYNRKEEAQFLRLDYKNHCTFLAFGLHLSHAILNYKIKVRITYWNLDLDSTTITYKVHHNTTKIKTNLK